MLSIERAQSAIEINVIGRFPNLATVNTFRSVPTKVSTEVYTWNIFSKLN